MKHSDKHRKTLYLFISLAGGLALTLAGSWMMKRPITRAAEPQAPAATFSVTPTSGAANTTVQFSGCGWGKGETVDIVFDDPPQTIGTTVVQLAGGCFETEGTIPNEAAPGVHTIDAVGDMGNGETLTFTVTAAELFLTPARGPAGSTVEATGSGWNPTVDVEVLWSDGATLIGSGETDAQGHFTLAVSIPATATVGVKTLSAQDAGGASTFANFEVTAPALALTPDDGPPQRTVTASGCGWRPGEGVTLAWETMTNTLTTAQDPDQDGCIEAFVTVPAGAGYGERTVYGVGDATGATATTAFEVRDPGFQFFPTSGPVESSVTAYGCGWVGNPQIDVQWSDGTLMETTSLREDGCFDVDVTIPLDAEVGAHEATAVGSGGGVATATFTVSNTATLDLFPNPQGSGDQVRVYGLGWIEGETVSVRWPTGALLGSEQAPSDGTISFDTTIPRDAATGIYTVTASGDKGSRATERFQVENDSDLVMFNTPAGATQDACLDDWAHGEQITIRWPTGHLIGSATYSWTNTFCGFRTEVTIPSDAATGTYTVTATGDKGGYDEEPVTVKLDTIDPVAWLYHRPDALPTDQTATLIGWGSDNAAVSKIELLVDGNVIKTCRAPFSGSREMKTCQESGVSLAAGLHTLQARVYDLAGNRDTATSRLAAFVPGEPPTVTLSHAPTNPGDGQPVEITVRAEDSSGGIETLLIQVNEDGPAYLGQDYDFFFSAPFPGVVERTVTFTPTPGKRVLNYEALAFDAENLTTRSDERVVLVGNGLPDSDDDGIGDAHEAILCTSPTNPDTDRDGLRDGWEILGLGFPDGDVIDLPTLGADPCVKDVFVQYDYEEGTKIPDRAIQGAVNTFRDHNVQLHVEMNERPHSGTSNSMTSTLKADTASYAKDSSGDYFFDPKRNWTHYYVYSRHHPGRSSTWNHATIDYHSGDWDCPPSVDDPQADPDCQASARSRWDLQYRFIHELGHDMGLGHGGRSGTNAQRTNGDLVYYDGGWDSVNRKPNYLSVMNYRYNRGNLCYDTVKERFVGRFDFQDRSLPTLVQDDLDERPGSTFAVALRAVSCDEPDQVPAISYTCTDPDEQDDVGEDVTYQMISDGLQTLARKRQGTRSYTTTVPFHPSGIDWNCDGQIESSVSEDINAGRGTTFSSRNDWVLLPQGRACLLGDADRISAIGYPSDYVDDTYGPPCPSTAAALGSAGLRPTLASPQWDEPEEPLVETDSEEAILDGLPNFEACDGADNDGDEAVDEGCPDGDADGVSDDVDNCPLVANSDQADLNADFRGDACEGRPGAPVDVEAEAVVDGVALTWDPPAAGQPIGYNVYRRAAGESTFRHVGSYPTSGTTTYVDTQAADLAGEVAYRVRALNRYAEEGDVSATVSVALGLGARVYLPLVTRGQ